MTVHPCRPITIGVACAAEAVYAYTADPENMADWAAGIGDGLRRSPDDNDVWIADTPTGEARVRFSPANPFGVLDHWVTLPDGTEISVPLRVVANGDGAEVTLTLFHLPAMDDAAFERDAAAVTRDLEALKARLEQSSP
ncbi:SRPBCC family protein [Caulobacter endophyticus]|uniref:SRPBCC family protein n=1 Tax=Caulobacter endophyticus TaxID=2172652 RepID=UPI00240F33E2|nr:SRPBCC family protein [Caulobacter endophyticus]MDG2530774.1 SRPBCC family protein [Caulobacter endophyticus]